MEKISFKDYELTQMSTDEILAKAIQLKLSLDARYGEKPLQHCVDLVIRAYASYNPDEEKVGTYA